MALSLSLSMAPPNPNAQRFSPTMMWASTVRTFSSPCALLWEEAGQRREGKTPVSGRISMGRKGAVWWEGRILSSDCGMKERGWVLTWGHSV